MKTKFKGLIFTGNRAEFSILLPLIIELEKAYQIDLLVSGAHLIEPWNTINEITQVLEKYKLDVSVIKLPIKQDKNYYFDSFSQIYSQAFNILAENKYDFSVCLGDRVETMAFTSAAFFTHVPIFHLNGGDVGNVPYFDTNIRHAITKLAHIHFPSNEKSASILKQLGEEDWRIINTGHLALDITRLGLVSSEESLIQEYNLSPSKAIILLTYHPSQFKSELENLADFEEIYSAVVDMEDSIKIITYPNNDPGHELIMKRILELAQEDKDDIRIVPNLGASNLYGLLQHFNAIVIGNSSSGIYDTAYFCTPTLNIGDRQTDRPRGNNVEDISINKEHIRGKVLEIINNYDSFVEKYAELKFFFGDGNAANRACEAIGRLLESGENLIIKKFVIQDAK